MSNISSFTGLAKDTDWLTFVRQCEDVQDTRDTFATNISAMVEDGNPVFQAPELGLATGTSVEVTDHLTAGGVGETGSGYLLINGNESGAHKLTVADATAYTVTSNMPAQTVGDATLSYPDFAGVDDEYTFKTKSQTMDNKTLTTPVIATGLTASGSAANDFSGSTGAFKTSTGLNTFGGTAALKLIATPVAAAGAGGGVAGAAALGEANVTLVSSDGATKGVKLTTGVAGQVKIVVNTSGTACNIFAASGGTLNGASADVGKAIPASKGVICICTAADTWYVFDLTALAGAAA